MYPGKYTQKRSVDVTLLHSIPNKEVSFTYKQVVLHCDCINILGSP